MEPRPCRVRAGIQRPPAPPWIVMPVPLTERADWWPGTLLSWRWIDREAGLWPGHVRYSHDGLSYEHAVAGDLIEVETATRCPGCVDTAPCRARFRRLRGVTVEA